MAVANAKPKTALFLFPFEGLPPDQFFRKRTRKAQLFNNQNSKHKRLKIIIKTIFRVRFT